MKTYKVTGMGCAACQARVEKAVSALPNVTACTVNLLTNSMTVEGTATEAEVIQAVVDAGYDASSEDDSESDAESELTDTETPALKRRLVLSVGFLAVLMYLAMSHQMGYVQLVLALIVMIINRKFFISGFKAVIHAAPNMDTLVAMGSAASFIWSTYTLFTNSGDLYFDSAAMILTLITVGKMLEARSKGKTTDAIKSLIELAPKTATVIRDGEELIVQISAVRVGEVFLVHPGESVAVDGEVIEGESTIDESALTGENIPVGKKAGDSVSAATLNQAGLLKCRATRVGKDTTFAQIIKLVKEASATKAPIAKSADKVSGIFVPVVIGIALVTLIIWMILGSGLEFALTRAVSVLVISCPCALGLATPVAIMVASGVGAKHGILFKNAESLEITGKIKTVILDKTGTITTGKGDEIRADSKSAIETIKSMGIRVIMLSGDKRDAANKIASEVGVDEVISEVLPADKECVVRELKEHGMVAMVGDGINDAPALTTADVGIAIGAGTDVAIDAADIVLTNSKLSDVVSAIKLSRATLRNIHQNLFWAFIYNAIGIPLAAGCFIALLGWQLNPMIGAAAMSLSSFCVVTNALRLNFFH